LLKLPFTNGKLVNSFDTNTFPMPSVYVDTVVLYVCGGVVDYSADD
jgi:hypothetical protein